MAMRSRSSLSSRQYACRQRGLYTPVVPVQAIDDCATFQASTYRPVFCDHRAPIKLNQSSRPRIPRLFSPGCPPYVPRLIVTVVVDAIDRMSGSWGSSHVFKERFKRVRPPVADSHTTAAVPRKILFRGIAATPFNPSPCSVLLRWFMSVFSRSVFAVRCECMLSCLRALFTLQASAASSWPGTEKRMSPDGSFNSAIAAAEEPRTGASMVRFAVTGILHEPSSESVTGRNITGIHVSKCNTPEVLLGCW